MKLGPTIAICALVLALLGIWVGAVGWAGELIAIALIGAAAIGAQIGLRTRVSVPAWLAPALAAGGIAALLMAFTQYNDDGPSGPLFVPLLYLGFSAIPATAVVAGVSVGRHLGRRRDANAR